MTSVKPPCSTSLATHGANFVSLAQLWRAAGPAIVVNPWALVDLRVVAHAPGAPWGLSAVEGFPTP